MVFILLVGCGTDTPDLAICEDRFQYIGRIHGPAAGSTGTDNGMYFVDEQDGIRLLFKLGQDLL